MVKNAEAKQRELDRVDESGGGLFLLKNDARVTRVGKWLRKFSYTA
jgi:lipopolysaccharide/colanic/teichoic acid biosynthesis glycosyltransferase